MNPIEAPPAIFSITKDEAAEDRSISRITDTVKKIVFDQQAVHTKKGDYPVITKHEPVQKEMDRKAFDDLKLKCQHFAKLFNTTRINDARIETPQKNSKPLFEQRKRPIYVASSTTTTTAKSGFYITASSTIKPVPSISTITSTTTINPSTVPTVAESTTAKPPAVVPKVQYIRLEPVILQKTILSDGRTVYLWHKSLPSALPFTSANLPKQAMFPKNDEMPMSTESPTTASYSRFDFRNIFSFYGSPTTEAPSTTTTATTNNVPHLYNNQVRFVVPVPLDNNVKYPWYNGYNDLYYQKDASQFNVPYQPPYQVLKAVPVGMRYQKYNERLDDVKLT
ncbi:unnamed protein product [Brassicogethes aeneus]|uniref:Uncharacterized protein n=1 Tax=Brassicogethes aeneus TaxID=1431903 RepID=A0A9P0ASZ7_BRAAE|nr:unnamed protein product [Brassicogethes aeneus]